MLFHCRTRNGLRFNTTLLVLLFLLAACAPAGPVTTQQVQNPVQPTAPLAQAKATSTQGASTQLRIYVMANSEAMNQVITTLADGFVRAHPDYKFVLSTPQDFPAKEIVALAKAGTPPDLVLLPDGILSNMVENDLLLNLRELMAADEGFRLDAIRPAVLAAGRVSGKPDLYAMPVSVLNDALFYNKDMFKKAGVSEPGEDMTWDDLISECRKIQDANKGITCLGTGNASSFGSWYPFVRGFGGDIQSKDGNTSTFSSAETSQALQYYTDLWTRYHIAQNPNESAVDCIETQKCAVAIRQTDYIVDPAPKFTFDWGLQLVPKLPKGRFGFFTAIQYGIAKSSTHPQQAWAFIKYLLSPEAQQQMAGSGLGMTVLRQPPANAIPAKLATFYKGLDSAVRAPDYPDACGNFYFGDLQSLTQNAIENAIKGYAKLADGLKQADGRLNQCLLKRK